MKARISPPARTEANLTDIEGRVVQVAVHPVDDVVVLLTSTGKLFHQVRDMRAFGKPVTWQAIELPE